MKIQMSGNKIKSYSKPTTKVEPSIYEKTLQEMNDKITALETQLQNATKNDPEELTKLKKALSDTLVFMMQFRAATEERFNKIPHSKNIRMLDYILLGIGLLTIIKWCI